MTVQELFDQLKSDLNLMPQIANRDIVCQTDPEGNGYHHLSGIDTSNNYYEGAYNLEVIHEDHFEEMEYDEEDKERMSICAVIYP